MTRLLTILNLVGVLALAGLCAQQWKVNREVNQEAIASEQIRIAQVAKLAEQERTIAGYIADLEELRGRLASTETALTETGEKLADKTVALNHVTTEKDELSAERDELKKALEGWIAAVAARDAALKRANEEIDKVVADRNDAVVKFNDLAKKYNALVKEVNEERAREAAATRAATQP
jgi:uncharacterized coiled-coil DUF342 family protein